MGKRRKILIAEDSPTQALKLQMTLEEKDYEVLHGLNGEEVLKLIDENDLPEIIITDIIMPVMDGYELCRRLKQNEKTNGIPVILLTQLSNPEDVIKGLQAGADNFISKPYSDKFLFERISDILLNREIRRRSPNLDIEMEIYFGGHKYRLNSNRLQILDLLLSTYHNAINKNNELEDRNLELKQLQKELEQRNQQLKESIDEKNHFLGIAAHDLRSPLCTVSSYFELISDTLKDDSIANQLQVVSTINNTLDFMLNLITDVLDYAKIESGKLNLNIEEFNIIAFLDEVIVLNNILAAQKKINIVSDYKEETIIIEADANKLKQVMNNLLSNAMKFSDSETEIHVNVEKLDKEVRFSVIDQGKGIPEDELDKLFKPFSTTSVRSTAGEKSTGLGLVSVKKIIETHGGRMWVESEVGMGSKFHFSIPYLKQ